MIESLDALPRASLRALEGVAFDVDDTVTRDGMLEPEALAAMYALRSAGLSLAAVTGRPLGWVDVLVHQWPIDLGIGENGAGWVIRRPTGPVEGYLEGPPETFGATRARFVAAARAHDPDVRLTADHRARRCDVAFDIGEHAELPSARVEALARALEALGATTTRSTVHLHAAAAPWTKARGLVAALAAAFGTPHDEVAARWLFVGDSPNDEPAFAAFPLSVGVANVATHLARMRARPRYVTRADRGRGFAELAARILAARTEGSST